MGSIWSGHVCVCVFVFSPASVFPCGNGIAVTVPVTVPVLVALTVPSSVTAAVMVRVTLLAAVATTVTVMLIVRSGNDDGIDSGNYNRDLSRNGNIRVPITETVAVISTVTTWVT